MSNLKKNIAYSILYQVLILFLPFVTAPYLSRVLGAEGIGIYSYSYSITTYFIYFAMLGLNNYGNRSIAMIQNQPEQLSKTFCEIYAMQLITSSICIISYAVYAVYFAQNTTVAIIQIVYMISTVFDVNWFFFGMEMFKFTVIRNTLIKIVTVILIFLFIKNETDIYLYVLIMSGGTFLSQVSLLPILHRFIKYQAVRWISIKKHFLANIILFLPVIAVSIYKTVDKIMLGSIASMSEVGYFENAEKIINVPIALITALGTVMLPRMTAIFKANNINESNKYIDKSMLFALFIANGSAFGLAAISMPFVYIFYGAGFIQSGIIIVFLAPTIIILAWGNVIRTQYLIPKQKDKIYIISAIIGAVINVVINLILIPKYGSVGAAIGTISAEFFVCFFQTYSIWTYLEFKKYLRLEFIFLLCGFLMWAVIVNLSLFSNIYYSLISEIIIGAVIYIVLCLSIYKLYIKKWYESV